MKKNTLKKVIDKQVSLVVPDKESMKYLEKLTKEFIEVLNRKLSDSGIDADAFVGGSFAKDTLVKENGIYDVDILVRFDWKYEILSELLNKVLIKVCEEMKLRLERIHGSRDYFKVKNGFNGYFEIIPVTRIKKPREERNITDLTYFHVPYVKRKIKGLENQVRIAKVFLKAQKVYGAETYVKGFSGYAVELLIIKYKSFVKMLRELSKVEKGERIVIDIENFYKKNNEIFVEMNESKLNNPVILVDPTYKERNALAALSFETFYKFQETAKRFLENPSEKFFIEKKLNIDSMRKNAEKKNLEFLHLTIKTNKQEGDIAGTKIKKFADMLILEFMRYFKIIRHEFQYQGKKDADLILILKSMKEVVRIGPPLHLKKFVRDFKKEHMNTYEKNKMIHAKIVVNFTAKSFFDAWIKSNERKIKEMGIVGIWVVGD